jgi:rhamnosyltransferase subunit B
MPMQVVIFALGSAGDVHPFLGIGRTLAARGHSVTIAASGFFENVVTNAGLGFRPLGTAADYDRLCADPNLWHPRKGLVSVLKHGAQPTYRPILDIIRTLHAPGKTLMIGSSLAFGARNARDLLGIPLVTVHLAPALLPSLSRQPEIAAMPFGRSAPRFLRQLQWALAAQVIDRLVLPDLNRFRREHGLPPASRIFHDWWHSPDRTIALFPEWFAPRQPDWPPQVRHTGFPLFDESGLRPPLPGLAEFLNAGEPPVVFTPGSAMGDCGAFFREAVAALMASRRRGILLTRFPAKLPTNLPREIKHFPYIPLSEVLPRAAALVYHGGIGTCAQALRAGIPHLILPMAHDQHDNLSRIRDLGVGDGLAARRAKAGEIGRRLDRILSDPAIRRNTREAASLFEPERWMAQTCDLIEATRFTG